MSDNSLRAIDVTRLRPHDRLTSGGAPLDITVGDFWAWTASNLLDNTWRGILAEFIVAHALGIELKRGVREDWAPYDLKFGDIQIEVKASAHIQSWHQEKYSAIRWSIAEKQEWVAETGKYKPGRQRHGAMYVLALFKATDDVSSSTPLDVSQWVFYVVDTNKLPSAKSVSLEKVKSLAAPARYDELRAAVERCRSAIPR